MRALDRLKKAANLVSSRKVVVLNDGTEFEFWSTPLTMAERARARKDAKSDDANEFALQLMITKAHDAAGQRMFNPGEIAELRNEVRDEDLQNIMLAIIREEATPEASEMGK